MSWLIKKTSFHLQALKPAFSPLASRLSRYLATARALDESFSPATAFRLKQIIAQESRHGVWLLFSILHILSRPLSATDPDGLGRVSCNLLFVSRFCSAFRDKQTKKSHFTQRLLGITHYLSDLADRIGTLLAVLAKLDLKS